MTMTTAPAPAGSPSTAHRTAAAAPAAPDRSAREVYRDTVAELLPREDRLVVLDSDTGLFGGVDFGAGAERYLNIGIAEHTLMGAAAGLAREGRIPLVNTMAAFASSRALEAVKLDIALGNLPVLIAATHSGVSAGHLGPTHHALEDLATLRVLPHMTVVVPGDPAQTAELLRQALALGGPVYFRLGRGATPPCRPTPSRRGSARPRSCAAGRTSRWPPAGPTRSWRPWKRRSSSRRTAFRRTSCICTPSSRWTRRRCSTPWATRRP